MQKITLTELTNEKLQDIFTSEKFRNDVAFAHACYGANHSYLHHKTSSYPVQYIVTDEQIQIAKAELERARAETLKNLGNKLVFVGMGTDYKTTEKDDIGNYRIRTEFINKTGNRFFIEFNHGQIGHAVDVTRQVFLNDAHDLQSEFFNYKNLESQTPSFEYNKKSILALINKYFDCAFTEMEIDNFTLVTDEFVCISPEVVPSFKESDLVMFKTPNDDDEKTAQMVIVELRGDRALVSDLRFKNELIAPTTVYPLADLKPANMEVNA